MDFQNEGKLPGATDRICKKSFGNFHCTYQIGCFFDLRKISLSGVVGHEANYADSGLDREG